MMRLLAFTPDNRRQFSGRPFSFVGASRQASIDGLEVIPVRLGAHEEFRFEQLRYMIRQRSRRANHAFSLSSEYMTSAWKKSGVAIERGDVVLIFHQVAPKPVIEAAQAGICSLVCYVDMCLAAYLKQYEITTSIPSMVKQHLISQEGETLEACRKIFTFGSTAAESMLESYPIERSKIVPVGRGSNITDEERETIRRARAARRVDNLIHLVFNGVDAKRKGLFDAIEAIDQLPPLHRSRVELHVIGPGRETIPKRDYIVAHGFIDRDHEPERFGTILTLADCGILLSQAEGIPGSLFEFLACGIPVISTDLPAIVAAIGGRAASFVSVGSVVPQFKGTLLRLLDEPDMLRALNRSALLEMDDFNWRVVVERMMTAVLERRTLHAR